jgi:hypothetical protein
LFHRGQYEPEEGELHVGWLMSANDLHTRTTCVTAYREWSEQECELETPKLERIEFGSPYLKMLRKYASPYRNDGGPQV